MSVDGGNLEKNISPNLVLALQYAQSVGAKITGIIGRDGGYTAQVADACVIIPTVNTDNTTPHSEAFQAVIWHLLVSHPKLKAYQTKSYMISDRWRDVEAGNNSGCQTFFIDYGYTEKHPISMRHKVHTLQAAAQIILGDVA